jgi:hypothetical protein
MILQQECEETIEYGDVIPGARTVIYVAAIYKSNKLEALRAENF